MLRCPKTARVFCQLLGAQARPIVPVQSSWELTPFTRPHTCPFSVQADETRFQLQQPPYKLAVMSPHAAIDVEVITSGFEEIRIQESYEEGNKDQLSVLHQGSTVKLEALNRVQKVAKKVQPRLLTAYVPERYCDVDIWTAGGKVSVQSVTEGKLYVTSECGPVKLGKIKATTARVNTAGGKLSCDTVTANRVEFDTNGGSMSIKRLVGKDCLLNACLVDSAPPEPAPTAKDSTKSKSGAVKVDVAYTESLLVMTKGKPVTIGSLDTMNGHALLQTYGGSLSVQGLDGSARLESRGGSVQVNVQENVRDLQVSSQGGDITCTLPPTLGSVAAIIEPISQATFGEGLTYEGEGSNGKLHTSSNDTGYARQKSVCDRQGQEDKQCQTAQDKERLHSKTPLVKLKLDAQGATDDNQAGAVHVALESWISRAMNKAQDKTKQ